MKSLTIQITRIALFISLLLGSQFANSQCGPLSTPSFTNNGQSGIMFDIVALQSVNITQLAMDFDAGTYNIEVYYKAGTHVGFETNAAAWTLLGTANGWNATGLGTNTLIPVTFSQFLCAGDVGAFYVTANNSTNGNYSNGTGVGNVAAADANIQILQGTGKAYPFGTSFTPRVPNVTVYYACAISCCLPPTMSMTQETCTGSCDGTATATVGAGGVPPYTYQWDAAAGNQTTQTATNLCAGTYTVDVTDNTGCVSQGTITVTSGGTTANATITPAGPFCTNDLATNLTAVDPGGTWSGTGITDAVNGTFDPATAGPGTHTITYAIGGPCGDTQTTDITVNQAQNATITPVGPYCTAEPGFAMTAVDPGGTWSGTGITNGATGWFDPAVAGAGVHTITYDIPGPCGDIQTFDITINNNFDATITPAGPVCELDIAFNMTAVDPGGTWSGTGITNASIGTFDPGVAGAGIHTITYDIPGVCGDLQTFDITVDPALDATITPVGPFCDIEPAMNLTAVDPGGTWSGTGITDAVNGTFDPATAGAGVHTITYSIPGPCGDVQTLDITIDQAYDATITPAGPLCMDVPAFDLNAVDPGGTWSGTGITDAVNGTFDPVIAGPGIHTITYSIPGVCGDTQTTDITVNTVDDATITPAGPFCLGSGTTLVAVTGGGTWTGNGITDPIAGTFDASVAGTGVHTITYSTNGPCPDVATIDIVVNNPLIIQAFSDTTLCFGESANLSANGSGGDGNTSIVWTDGAGNIVGNGNNITVTPGVTTTYTATITDGCTTPPASASVTVTVNPIPEVSFSADNVIGCAPLDVLFTNTSTPVGTNCLWSYGNGESSTNCGSGWAQYNDVGCYDVTLTVNAFGCENSITYPSMICVVEYPVADFTASTFETETFETEIEFTNLSSNAETYAWDFDDGNVSSEEHPINIFPDTEPNGYNVCLIAYNEFGCPDTTCKPVSIVEPLVYYVPNSFTPDNDEFNQTFQPVFTSGFDPYDYNFKIFNRWGELIWESNDATVGWDGVYLRTGKLVQAGTYVWKVEYKLSKNDERHLDTGHVNIMK